MRLVSALLILSLIGFSALAEEGVSTDFARIEQLQREGKLEEAVEVCSKVLEQQKSLLWRVRALNKRAYLQTELKHYETALADTDEVFKFSKSDAQTYLTRGYTFERMKRYLEAVNAYDRALELEPGCFECVLRRAKTYKLRRFLLVGDGRPWSLMITMPSG